MPANSSVDDPDSGLPPPGQRWGAGAQSVLPYLTKTLQAKPASGSEAHSHAHAGADVRRHEHASAGTATSAVGMRRR